MFIMGVSFETVMVYVVCKRITYIYIYIYIYIFFITT